METDNPVLLCRLCDNYAPQRLVHVQQATATGDTFGVRTFEPTGAYYYVAVCETCKGILLYWANEQTRLEHKDFCKAELIWPQLPVRHQAVPKRVAEKYDLALRVKDEPDCFSVHIARALEEMGRLHGHTENNLNVVLEKLAKQDSITHKPVITPELLEVALAIKNLRNEGAHKGKGVQNKLVPVIEKFFLAVINHVYVIPFESGMRTDELQRLKKTAERINRTSDRKKHAAKSKKAAK